MNKKGFSGYIAMIATLILFFILFFLFTFLISLDLEKSGKQDVQNMKSVDALGFFESFLKAKEPPLYRQIDQNTENIQVRQDIGTYAAAGFNSGCYKVYSIDEKREITNLVISPNKCSFDLNLGRVRLPSKLVIYSVGENE